MKKLIIMVFTALTFVSCFAMASGDNKVEKQSPKHNHGKHHKFAINIYDENKDGAKVMQTVSLKDRSNYSVFYCADGGWCEVVNKSNGETGWVSLEQIKKAEEKLARHSKSSSMIPALVQHAQLQDQKIAYLQSQILRMQKDLSVVLQSQQQQINQIKQYL